MMSLRFKRKANFMDPTTKRLKDSDDVFLPDRIHVIDTPTSQIPIRCYHLGDTWYVCLNDMYALLKWSIFPIFYINKSFLETLPVYNYSSNSRIKRNVKIYPMNELVVNGER